MITTISLSVFSLPQYHYVATLKKVVWKPILHTMQPLAEHSITFVFAHLFLVYQLWLIKCVMGSGNQKPNRSSVDPCLSRDVDYPSPTPIPLKIVVILNKIW